MKLSKPVKTALVVLPFIIGGVLLLKYFRPKPKPENQPDNQNNQNNQNNSGGGFEKYTVTTNTSNLNIRSSASTSSSIVGSLSKGSEIFAKPSSTTGWHEYSADGKTTTGYVSSQYITKK